MARDIEKHRLILANYPHTLVIDTQYGDMDVYGHVNNIAIARFFESARVRCQREIFAGRKLFQKDAEYQMLVAENNLRFLAECDFPDPVVVGTALGRIGNSSFQFQHLLLQSEVCVAVGEAVMVCTQRGKPVSVPDEGRAIMANMLIGRKESL